ncbi:hypothetical protein I6F07_21185 [Ensifer sp. IC4062]|nr:hypothetical protein [Ensifer sp. IC4062]MCA1442688.1 hypothetical protein [Ensifer sp. IC4062]
MPNPNKETERLSFNLLGVLKGDAIGRYPITCLFVLVLVCVVVFKLW